MTVWETDTMPSQWRNTLNSVLEVWLPCDFNITAFRASIARPLVKLPHPVPHRNGEYKVPEPESFLRVRPDDFVIYSIFEWQDRKSPNEMLSAYLNAFDGTENTVFIMKSNPGSAAAARTAALERVRQSTKCCGSGA